MDFLHDALACGRKLRTLSIEDACTREMLAIEVDTSLPALRVIRVLEQLCTERGLPEKIIVEADLIASSTSLVHAAWRFYRYTVGQFPAHTPRHRGLNASTASFERAWTPLSIDDPSCISIKMPTEKTALARSHAPVGHS